MQSQSRPILHGSYSQVQQNQKVAEIERTLLIILDT